MTGAVVTEAVLHFDGGARPVNPGHAGFASVVNIAGNLHSISRYIGWKTNNQAEYFGLVVGVKYAHFLGARKIHIVTDSKLVKEQIEGNWQVREEELKLLRMDARDLLMKHFPGAWEIEWLKRDGNVEADALCTAAINWGRNLNPLVPAKIKKARGKAMIVDPFQSTRTMPRLSQSPQRSVRHKGLSTLLAELDW